MGSLFWRLPEDLIDEELRILKQILERYPELELFYQSVQTFRKSIKEANYELFLDWLREKLNPENSFFTTMHCNSEVNDKRLNNLF